MHLASIDSSKPLPGLYTHLFWLLLWGVIWNGTGCKQAKDPIPYKAQPYPLAIPASLPDMDIPEDNPLTVEGVALGRRLFYDPILSADSTQSCASCHRQAFAFVDSSLQLSTGIDQVQGTRNAMPLFNLAWQGSFFWDGGASNLESQVVGPITNPVEMHEDLPNVVVKLNRHPEYPNLFRQAFELDAEEAVTIPMLMKAIAQFERTLLSGDSKYDHWKQGQASLTDQELRGLALYQDFEKGDCSHCHVLGSTFSDFAFRNTGLDSIPVDEGRYRITLNPADLGKFKTPSLRNIALTAPYMHDGRFQTLEEVLEFYNTGFHHPSNLDANLEHAIKGRLTVQDKEDLIAFLHTLTDFNFIQNPDFSKPD
ncbi:MAG: cytochrome c peroxidase [Saprospiraceae bacterium]